MKKKKSEHIDLNKITGEAWSAADRKNCIDDLVVFGQTVTKTEIIDGHLTTTRVETYEPAPPDRRNEPFAESVRRYLDHPKDETPEQRASRINRFRCGY